MRKSSLAGMIVCGAVVSACAFQDYEPEALNAETVIERLREHNLDAPGLRDFMVTRGQPVASWPMEIWDLDALTRASIYFHPDIAEAKSRIAVFEARQITAGQRPNPTIAVEPEYHGKKSEHSSSPWSWGLMFDIPFVLPSKREARLDEAAARLRAARLEAGAAVWRVRAGLRASLVDVYAAERRVDLSQAKLAFHRDYLALLEQRLRLGEATRFETSAARLELDSARLALKKAGGDASVRRAELAAGIGLDSSDIAGRRIDFGALRASFVAPPPNRARQAGLRNRLDVSRSLTLYAVAEARLRREIANQYPDFSLSPGVFWDQGDLIWRLGGAIAAPFFNINEGPIAEARAARRHAAARFTTLQAGVLADLDIASVVHATALETWVTASRQVEAKQRRVTALQLDLENDAADHLTLAAARRELLALREALLESELSVIRAFGRLEDAIEMPLDGGFTPIDLTVDESGGAAKMPEKSKPSP